MSNENFHGLDNFNNFDALDSDLIFDGLTNFDCIMTSTSMDERYNLPGSIGHSMYQNSFQQSTQGAPTSITSYPSHCNQFNLNHQLNLNKQQYSHQQYSRGGKFDPTLQFPRLTPMTKPFEDEPMQFLPPSYSSHCNSSRSSDQMMVLPRMDTEMPLVTMPPESPPGQLFPGRGRMSMSMGMSIRMDAEDDKVSKNSKAQATLAKEKRRERNKVLARKTRVKKKFELESLRDQAASLFKENEALKRLVHSKLPTPVGAHILLECDVQLPDNVAAVVNHLISKSLPNNDEGYLIQKIKTMQRSFCISNACAPDFPLVYASPGFIELTGYPITEIIGRNCRFLQGPDTDKSEVARLSHFVREGVEGYGVLKNYRRDCSMFWNFIQLSPMRDVDGRVTLIIGVLCEVTSPHTLIDENLKSNASEAPYASLTEATALQTNSNNCAPRPDNVYNTRNSIHNHHTHSNSSSTSNSSSRSAASVSASSNSTGGHTSNEDAASQQGSQQGSSSSGDQEQGESQGSRNGNGSRRSPQSCEGSCEGSGEGSGDGSGGEGSGSGGSQNGSQNGDDTE